MVRHVDFSPEGLRLDARLYRFPAMVDSVHAGIGAHYLRSEYNDDNAVYTWDEFGFKAFGDKMRPYMAWFQVHVRRDEYRAYRNNPASVFTGTITVSGRPIEEVSFAPGWKKTLIVAPVGPYVLARHFDTPQGDYYELYIPNVGTDHFTPQPEKAS